MRSTKLTEWKFSKNGKDENVSIPHDFMIATERTPNSPTWADYGYFQPCQGTYSRTFEKDPTAANHFLKFDGVMGVTEVHVNGEHVKLHPYGYTAFVCDIGRFLRDGENNVRVSVNAMMQPASRWYTGAGIYREAELLTSDKDYFIPFGTFVRVLSINGSDAEIEVSTEIYSSACGEAEITYTVPELGRSFSRSTWLTEGENSFTARAILRGVTLWSPDTPAVYSCALSLKTAGSSDSESVTFGVRTVVCDPEKGFLLNGEPIKLYGTCNHHDNGIIGAASYRSAEERRVRILKENGFNAIRCAHNPASSMLLDVCDRMGMLVIDEIFDCWVNGKKAYDYHLWFDRYAKEDVTAMVKCHRNHPSVVMWSTGNEIYERGGKNDGYRVGKMIADTIKENDPSRPVTHAFCHFWDNWEYGKKMDETADYPAEKLDFWCEKILPQAGSLEILGYNYMTHRIEKDSVRFPEHLFAITESYPLDAVYVKRVMDEYPQLIGEFVWTGWDYLGETGLGHIVYNVDSTPGWGLTPHPEHISNCGDFDLCGNKKSPSYYRDAAWINGAVRILSMDPDKADKVYSISSWGFYDTNRTWTYPGKEGKMTKVHLYTTADECELFLNGVSLGKKAPDHKGVALFEVEYRPGKLEACSYKDGKVVGKDELFTVGEACSLSVKADVTDKTGKADLIYAEISLLDKDGNVAWNGDDEITVTVSGGKVIGTGSGKIDDTHNYTEPVCRAYHGRMLAAILPEGERVVITAKTEKMAAEITVLI